MHHNACLVNSNCIAIFMSSRREGTVEDALQDLDEDLTGSVSESDSSEISELG